MAGRAWAKARRLKDEKCWGGQRLQRPLALPSEQQKWGQLALPLLRAHMKQMFLLKTDCFALQHSALNGSPRTSPNEGNA